MFVACVLRVSVSNRGFAKSTGTCVVCACVCCVCLYGWVGGILEYSVRCE